MDFEIEIADATEHNSFLLESASAINAFRLGYIRGRVAGLDAEIQNTRAEIARLGQGIDIPSTEVESEFAGVTPLSS